jgi:hypothetical protein
VLVYFQSQLILVVLAAARMMSAMEALELLVKEMMGGHQMV